MMERCKTLVLSLTHTEHVAVHACSLGLAFVAQLTFDIFFSLARDGSAPNALFQTSLRNVSETFPLQVTMDWWSEIYWIMIDFWSKLWLLQAMVGLFQRNMSGPQSCHPEVHSPVFYLMWTIVSFIRILSLCLWESHDVMGVLFLRLLVSVLSFLMLHMSVSSLQTHLAWLRLHNPALIAWTRYLTQNGLAAFAWWSLLDTLGALGVVLKYRAGVPDPLVSAIVLTIVFLGATAWFNFEMLLWTKSLRHIFSIYPILILGLGAMFTRCFRVHDFNTNTIYSGTLMLILTGMSVIHLFTACFCKDRSADPDPAEPELSVRTEVWVITSQPEEPKKQRF